MEGCFRPDLSGKGLQHGLVAVHGRRERGSGLATRQPRAAPKSCLWRSSPHDVWTLRHVVENIVEGVPI